MGVTMEIEANEYLKDKEIGDMCELPMIVKGIVKREDYRVVDPGQKSKGKEKIYYTLEYDEKAMKKKKYEEEYENDGEDEITKELSKAIYKPNDLKPIPSSQSPRY